MRKIAKLVLGLSLLAGSLTLGVAPKVAEAGPLCPAYYCCDPDCVGIRPCWRVGGSCICAVDCQFNDGGRD